MDHFLFKLRWYEVKHVTQQKQLFRSTFRIHSIVTPIENALSMSSWVAPRPASAFLAGFKFENLGTLEKLERTFWIFALVGSFTALSAYWALSHSFPLYWHVPLSRTLISNSLHPLVLRVRDLINSFSVYIKGEAVDFNNWRLSSKALITGSYQY